jgi:hypothetical protein
MAIEFSSLNQQDAYERLKRLFEAGSRPFRVGLDRPYFLVDGESAVVQAWVQQAGDSIIIRVISWVVLGATSSDPELLRLLLRKNAALNLGAFGVDEEGDICLSHGFLGADCEPAQLWASLDAILSVADSMDDEIVARWGGHRAIEPVLKDPPPAP